MFPLKKNAIAAASVVTGFSSSIANNLSSSVPIDIAIEVASLIALCRGLSAAAADPAAAGLGFFLKHQQQHEEYAV